MFLRNNARFNNTKNKNKSKVKLSIEVVVTVFVCQNQGRIYPGVFGMDVSGGA